MAKDLKRRIVAEFSAQNKAKGAMAGFRKDMDNTGRSMLRMAKGALAMAGMGGGLYAAKRGFDYLTKAAMKQEDVEARLATTLKATGSAAGFTKDELLKQASALQKMTRFGDETITSMHTMLLTFKEIKGDVFERTTMAVLDMATAMAASRGGVVDLNSAVIQIGKALNDPITGMTTLSRVGVRFTEAQKEQVKTLIKTGRLYEAQVIILNELEGQFGGMSTTIDTASGAFDQMWNAVSDLAEVMGKPFIDTMAKDAKRATTNIEILTGALKKYKEGVEEAIKAEGRLKYMPIGVPFYAPQVPKDFIERPTGREPLAGQLADQAWAMKELAKAYEEGGKQEALREERVEAVDKRRMETEEAWGKIYLKREDERLKKIQEMDKAIIDASQVLAAAADEALQEIEQRADEFAMTFRDVIASGFEQSMRDAKNWEEHMINMLENVYWAAVRMAFLDPMAGVLAKGMTKGLEWLLGPGIFATPAPTTPTVFTSPHGGPASSLQHGGEVLETGWAKVHKGEKYSGVGGGRLEVNVTYVGDERPVVEEAEFDFKQQVLNITMQAFATDGAFRRSIKQAIR